MTLIAGIDIGSAYSKALIMKDEQVVSHHVVPSGGNFQSISEQVLAEALKKLGISPEKVSYVVATGIGASSVSFADHRATDISCQGRGIQHLFPSVRTIIDIGGQSSKVTRINEEGGTVDFIMSEKCASGSGRFLQIIARVLQMDLEDIGPLSLKSKETVDFTTSCAVFAESEAISRLSEGASREDILAGVHTSIAAKIFGLVKRIGLVNDYAVTGGGAKDIGLVESIAQAIGIRPFVPEEPQLSAALGAALIAQAKVSC